MLLLCSDSKYILSLKVGINKCLSSPSQGTHTVPSHAQKQQTPQRKAQAGIYTGPFLLWHRWSSCFGTYVVYRLRFLWKQVYRHTSTPPPISQFTAVDSLYLPLLSSFFFLCSTPSFPIKFSAQFHTVYHMPQSKMQQNGEPNSYYFCIPFVRS